jgi:hypothetical protein
MLHLYKLGQPYLFRTIFAHNTLKQKLIIYYAGDSLALFKKNYFIRMEGL